MAQKAIQDLVTLTFNEPGPLDPNLSTWEKMKWKAGAEQTLRDEQTWTEVKIKAFNLLLLHCHPLLSTALKGATTWKAVLDAENPIDLLKLTRSVIHEGVGPKGEGGRAVNNWIRLMCTHQTAAHPREVLRDLSG